MSAPAVNTAVDFYRPVDRDTARVAALELSRQGLLPRDIAEALAVSESAVLALLGETA